MWRSGDPNPEPLDCRSSALPIELERQALDAFYRYEYFHMSLALADSLFLAFSFCSKFQNFIRDPNIFPKLDTDASRID